MSTEGNGSHATRAELLALEKLFDAKLKPLGDGLDRVEEQYVGIAVSLRDLSTFMISVNAAKEERSRLRDSSHFWVGLAAAFVTAMVAGAGSAAIVIAYG